MAKRHSRKRPSSVPAWAREYVLARLDQDGPYCPANMHWRFARTEKEARWGLEECEQTDLFEPDRVPLDPQQQAQRAALASDEDRVMFDIWARIIWRARATGGITGSIDN